MQPTQSKARTLSGIAAALALCASSLLFTATPAFAHEGHGQVAPMANESEETCPRMKNGEPCAHERGEAGCPDHHGKAEGDKCDRHHKPAPAKKAPASKAAPAQ